MQVLFFNIVVGCVTASFSANLPFGEAACPAPKTPIEGAAQIVRIIEM
jgi:hypothetical protein